MTNFAKQDVVTLRCADPCLSPRKWEEQTSLTSESWEFEYNAPLAQRRNQEVNSPIVRCMCELQASDLLMSCGERALSVGVKAVDLGRYSHGSLWTHRDTSEILEAVPGGVKRSTLSERLEASGSVDIFRHRGVTSELGQQIVECSTQYEGAAFSELDLLLGALVLTATAAMPCDWLELNALAQAGALRTAANYPLGWMSAVLEAISESPRNRFTCVGLICQCYLDAGLPIWVKLAGGRKPALGDLYRAALDGVQVAYEENDKTLWPKKNGLQCLQGELASTAMRLGRELKLLMLNFEVASPLMGRELEPTIWVKRRTAWLAELGLIDFAVSLEPGAEVDQGLQRATEDIRSTPLRAAADWPRAFITPRQLEWSEDLRWCGRLTSPHCGGANCPASRGATKMEEDP